MKQVRSTRNPIQAGSEPADARATVKDRGSRRGIGMALPVWMLVAFLAVTLPRVGTCGPAEADVAAMAAGTSSAAPWAMPADTVARLRTMIGDHPIHLRVASSHLTLRKARLDSLGVTFKAWEQEYDPFVYGEWVVDTLGRKAAGGSGTPLTMIRWSHINTVEIQDSHALLGAVVGTGLGLLAAAGIVSSTNAGMFSVIVVVPASIIVPMLVGTAIGSSVPRRTLVWKRWTTMGGAR